MASKDFLCTFDDGGCKGVFQIVKEIAVVIKLLQGNRWCYGSLGDRGANEETTNHIVIMRFITI